MIIHKQDVNIAFILCLSKVRIEMRLKARSGFGFRELLSG